MRVEVVVLGGRPRLVAAPAVRSGGSGDKLIGTQDDLRTLVAELDLPAEDVVFSAGAGALFMALPDR